MLTLDVTTDAGTRDEKLIEMGKLARQLGVKIRSRESEIVVYEVCPDYSGMITNAGEGHIHIRVIECATTHYVELKGWKSNRRLAEQVFEEEQEF